MADADTNELRTRIISALRQVYDPEIPVNIYDLGLIYELAVTPDGDIHVQMTLTSPNCPVAESLPPYVESTIRSVDGVRGVQLELVWEPPWSRERMSKAALLELGLPML